MGSTGGCGLLTRFLAKREATLEGSSTERRLYSTEDGTMNKTTDGKVHEKGHGAERLSRFEDDTRTYLPYLKKISYVFNYLALPPLLRCFNNFVIFHSTGWTAARPRAQGISWRDEA